MPNQYSKIPLSTRFWAKVEKTPTCWIWKGRISARYGYLSIKNKGVRAHSVAWQLTHPFEPIKGLCVCHTCDNPICVRPSHLWLGTVSENSKDALAKGRLKGLFQVGHPLLNQSNPCNPKKAWETRRLRYGTNGTLHPRKGGGRPKGFHHSPETREKMRKAYSLRRTAI